MTTADVVRFCTSTEEKRKRPGIFVVNLLVWAWLGFLVFATLGSILILYAITWIFRVMFAEFNVRRVQALGTAVSEKQFPEVTQALRDVCDYLGVEEEPRVIVLNDSQLNAFAMSFAKRRVVVLLSETLEGIIKSPSELRFIIGHEIGHHQLDFSRRGHFEIYRSAAYKAAREMTCDNIGHYVSGDLQKSKRLIRRLAVGHVLESRLDEEYLIEESDYLYSGFTGWLLKNHFTYPAVGKRLLNLMEFDERLRGMRLVEGEAEADELEVVG